jgi:hypothetical protein
MPATTRVDAVAHPPLTVIIGGFAGGCGNRRLEGLREKRLRPAEQYLGQCSRSRRITPNWGSKIRFEIHCAVLASGGLHVCAFFNKLTELAACCEKRPAAAAHHAIVLDARRLRLGDAFDPPLAANVGLELGEHAQHVEEALAGRRTGIDRLLGGLQDRTAGRTVRTMF